ncbi:MAG: HAD family hydrolase, partial [Planktomarina sp.]
LAQSGLGDLFDNVHVVSEKDVATYTGIFGADVHQSAMVGNSMKSDIVPALTAGAAAIHIPAKFEWEMEKAEKPTQNTRFFTASDFGLIADILTQI